MSVTEESGAKASDEEREEGQNGSKKDKKNVGRIEEIQGVVIEAVFPEELPEIYHALLVPRRFGLGWTLNFGNPSAAMLLAGMVALIGLLITLRFSG